MIRESVTTGRLDVAIAAAFPEVSRSRAAALVREGAVAVDHIVRTKVSEHVESGQCLSLEIPELVATKAKPQDLPLRIVYEDNVLLVVDKAAGMVVHPAPGHSDGTLVNALLHHVDDLSGIGGVVRPGIVHRLDRGTSGLLVVAKTDAAHRDLSEQFAEHSAGRIYLALCAGIPKEPSGTIQSLLARHPTDRLRFASGDRGKVAITHWKRLAASGSIALLQCQLETGRTHQVRVHLSESGWPILGDSVYGFRKYRPPAILRNKIDPDRPLLHAWRLQFRHLDGRALVFEAPVPNDFQRVLDVLGMEVSESSVKL